MSKHNIIEKLGITPGPWEEGKQCDSVISKNYRSAENDHMGSREYYGGYCICESIEQKNRSVIAAAPEMLEALIDIIAKFQSIVPTNTKYVKEYQDEFLKNYDIQIKTIEKATGKSWEEIKESLNGK